MTVGLAYTLSQLTGRERGLFAVMAGVAVPLGVIFLAILPMLEARDAADARAREAEALLTWVADQVRLMPEEVGALAEEESAATIGIAGIEDSLVTADLRDQVVELANRSDGGVDLALEDAPFDRVSDWLRTGAAASGYTLATFRFEASDSGLVNARFELAAP